MVDLTSKDDEDARQRELEREKGRKEEQQRQLERDKAEEKGRKTGHTEEYEREQKVKAEQDKRDLAQEKGRKQGQEEERRRGNQGGGSGGTWLKVVLAIVVIAIVVVIAAYLTLSVTVTQVSTSDTFPFTTNYGVSIPEGKTITIGNSQITVLSYQNDIISDIDGNRQKLVVGESRGISERRAVVTTLGAITLMDTLFQVNLTYKGVQNNAADFDMAVHTSKQVPNYLIKQILPPEIDARPV